jgi:hypothetical protein
VQRTQWGCYESATQPVYFAGKLAERCPLIPYRDNSDWYTALFESYGWFKKGHFPEVGTYKDQPAVLMEAFLVVDHVMKEIEDRERRKADAKAKAAQRSAKGKRR